MLCTLLTLKEDYFFIIFSKTIVKKLIILRSFWLFKKMDDLFYFQQHVILKIEQTLK